MLARSCPVKSEFFCSVVRACRCVRSPHSTKSRAGSHLKSNHAVYKKSANRPKEGNIMPFVYILEAKQMRHNIPDESGACWRGIETINYYYTFASITRLTEGC